MHTKILLGIIVALTSGCTLSNSTPPSPALNFSFTYGHGSCATGEPQIVIWAEGSGIKFSGSVITPTPCYTLTATHRITGMEIIIDIKKQPLSGACIQCIGAVPFQGEIAGLGEGEYTVKVFLDGRALEEKILVLRMGDRRQR